MIGAILLLLMEAAVSASPVRTEVPIAAVVLSDGTPRYTIPVRIAGRTIAAGVDTGSVGLRVLPDAIAGSRESGPSRQYGYGAGTLLEGPDTKVEIGVGDLAADVAVQAIRSVGCAAARPDCPARRIAPSAFGLQGDGLPGEGFRAILGIGLARADLPNPLASLGARRWIVELPRPGSGEPGRLILNPTADDAAGFTPLTLADTRRDRANDAVQACVGRTDGSEPICAPTLIDSGAPGIEVVNHSGQAWPSGTAASLQFKGQAGQPAPAIDFTVGLRAQASRFAFVRDDRVAGSRIRSGVIAYLAYDVLYDADAGSIALRARAPSPDGPKAVSR